MQPQSLTSALWEAANTLRGSAVDRTDWKGYILPLLFFKRICDVWDEETAEATEAFGDADPALVPEVHRFVVPDGCHWRDIRETAANVGAALLKAMQAIERANPDTLYRVFGTADWGNKEKFSDELIKDLIEGFSAVPLGNNAVGTDVLGDAYEYLIGKFADVTRRNKAGEFYTPRSVVRMMVELLDPQEGESIYDPACGTGGMLLGAIEHVARKGGDRQTFFGKIYGREKNLTTWRLAHMNLAIRGIEANSGSQSADSFLRNLHPDLKAGYILANPPFNISDWSGKLLADNVRWSYGTPPVGNASYAWIRHFVHHLAPPNGHGGVVAGFVMANGSLSCGSGGEGDLVDFIVALPAQFLLTTGIPACLWFLTRDKTGRNLKHGGRDRKGETLFIDARKLGTMQTRTLRVLTAGDDGESMLADGMGIRTSIPTSAASSTPSASGAASPIGETRPSTASGGTTTFPASARARRSGGIGKHGFVLTPGRYVGVEEQEDDGTPLDEKLKRLTATLRKQQAERVKRDTVVIAATHLRIQAVRPRAGSGNPVPISGNRTRSADNQTSEFTACR